MFTAAAELYDAIYFSFKDYVAEASDIAQRIRKLNPSARSLLDVACGTGEHARLLTNHGFLVDGVDINEDFLRLARTKVPGAQFHRANMADFSLNTRYDAVICMFSSIGYVCTLAELARALSCFARHVTNNGIVMVEPWFPPGVLEGGYHSERTAEMNGMHVVRKGSTVIEDRMSYLRFDYTITRGSDVQEIHETHELGLFTVDETLAAFAAAGLAAEHEAASERNRGLYIARRA
jgi:SAM-dependent methyltransferase